jgi:ABC-type nickel/cobalt efflux system permease component RcnA
MESVAIGSAGRSPALENISRGILVLIGEWMEWRAIPRKPHRAHQGEFFGFAAGLVP